MQEERVLYYEIPQLPFNQEELLGYLKHKVCISGSLKLKDQLAPRRNIGTEKRKLLGGQEPIIGNVSCTC